MMYFFFFGGLLKLINHFLRLKKCQKTRGQQLTKKEEIKKKNTRLTKARGNKDNYYKFYANIIL